MLAFTCECCGGRFETERLQEEAAAEFAQLFPGVPLTNEHAAMVCDDCWRKIMESNGQPLPTKAAQ